MISSDEKSNNRGIESPAVYIAILNWNGWQDTIDCLSSLTKSTYPNMRAVILDNASTDNSVVEIKQWTHAERIPLSEYIIYSKGKPFCPVTLSSPLDCALRQVILVRSSFNLGFCAGNNVILDFACKADADYVLILNNDTLCDPDFIQPLVEMSEANNRKCLVGGLICYAEDPNVIWWAGGKFNSFLETERILDLQPIDCLDRQRPYETDWISGCMTLIPMPVYSLLGGYDEQFFIWSDEWDLSIRAKREGIKLLFVPSSRIYHKMGRSLGVLKPLSYYYGTRNRLLLKKKHLNRLMIFLFFIWFIPTRLVRYAQLAYGGRWDLVHAGVSAITDYLLSRSGKWEKHVG